MYKIKILIIVILIFITMFLCAGTGLNCYKISWDYRIVKAYCWSSEFTGKINQSTETPEPTSTEVYLPPLPTSPNYYPTYSPYPYPYPTYNPYP